MRSPFFLHSPLYPFGLRCLPYMHPPSCGRRARARRAGLLPLCLFAFARACTFSFLVPAPRSVCIFFLPNSALCFVSARSSGTLPVSSCIITPVTTYVRPLTSYSRPVPFALRLFSSPEGLFTWLGTAHAPALSRYTYAYAHPYFLTRTTTIRLSQSLVFFPSFLSSFTFSAHIWSAGRINSDSWHCTIFMLYHLDHTSCYHLAVLEGAV